MEWGIKGKDIINWGMALLGIVSPMLFTIYNNKTRKKVARKNTHKKELEKEQKSIRKKSIWTAAKEEFFQYLPQRTFFIFILLIFSAFIKFSFGYSFLTSFNLSFVGFLICLFSWIFLNILKLWREASKAHQYFFSKEHKTYCLKEDKNCYCKVWGRSIIRLSFFSAADLLLVYFFVKLFLFLI